MYKTIILSKLQKYLQLKNWKIKKAGKMVMLVCPLCEKEPMSANIIPNTSIINCFACNQKYNLLDVAKKLEEKFPGTEEEQLQYLKDLLKVDVITKKDENKLVKLLTFYEKNNFDLVPVASKCPKCKNGCDYCEGTGNYGKNPIEKDWTNKSHKNKDEWFNWISNGLNIGVKTGAISGITVIDIDTKPIPEEIKLIVGKTLVQETKHGYQLFYKYDKDFPKTRIDELKIDIETDGGQVVLVPSKTQGYARKFLEMNDIKEMPEALKKLLLTKVTVPRKTHSEELKEEIQTENFKVDMFPVGNRNNSLIRLGGMFRKNFNITQTRKILNVLNNHNENPLPQSEVNAMMNKLEHYTQFDKEELAHEVLKYLKMVDSPRGVSDIANTIVGTNRGEEKKKIEEILSYLLKEEKIIKRGRSYEIMKEMNWTDTLLDMGVPVDFKVPYFHDYVYFNKKDLIILGSQNKYGKTTLSANFVKRLVEQGIKPCYVYNESGGRFGKSALKLGLKDGDMERTYCGDPDKLILKPNRVTIYDWVRPMGDDYAKTAQVFNNFIEQLENKDGFMICLVQLKKDDNWFAPNMIGQFPSLLVKYIYRDPEGIDTTFEICDVRDSKIGKKHFNIDTRYIKETREVKTLEELENEGTKK